MNKFIAMKRRAFVLSLGMLLMSAYSEALDQATPAPSAQSVIEQFYRAYLAPRKNQAPRAELNFSQSFRDLLQANAQVCKEKAGTDQCGWKSNGDVYLNTQESDPELTYENSKISITEPNVGRVEVRLNVYPSLKSDRYDRSITYVMIREKNQWVVDDLFLGNSSSREEIQKEISSYDVVLPTEVRDFLELRKGCEHLAGEDYTDPGRRKMMSKGLMECGLTELLTDEDKEAVRRNPVETVHQAEKRLRKKYRNHPQVLKAISEEV